jgi:hypothetical protein
MCLDKYRAFAFAFLTSPQPLSKLERSFFSPPSKMKGGWEGGSSESPINKNSLFLIRFQKTPRLWLRFFYLKYNIK